MAEGAAVVSSSLRCGVQILPTFSNRFLAFRGLSGGKGGRSQLQSPQCCRNTHLLAGGWGLVAEHGGAGNKYTKDQPTGVGGKILLGFGGWGSFYGYSVPFLTELSQLFCAHGGHRRAKNKRFWGQTLTLKLPTTEAWGNFFEKMTPHHPIGPPPNPPVH